jgi:hypothetical protein
VLFAASFCNIGSLNNKNNIRKMDNFDNKNWETQPAAAPEGMYDQVRTRIIQERIRIAQTHRQLVIGSVLLLVVGAVNIGLIFLKNTTNKPVLNENSEKILYKTYFDNAIMLSNEN